MFTVRGLSSILITPYEELRVWQSGKEVCSEEILGGGSTMKSDLELGGRLHAFGENEIDIVDCCYTGDHMLLELHLL